jgi:probable HAF family extracellular repeat protein
MEGRTFFRDTALRPHRVAATALAALFALAACAENPMGPVTDAARTASPSFNRASARPYTFTRLDVTGATQTLPSGINADGRVVGWYVQGGVTRGFIYQDGVYTPNIVYPGASVTQLRGVAPNGDAVGIYRMPGEPTVNFHSFVFTAEGEYVEGVRSPDHTSTMTQRILADGTLIGCVHDTDQMLTMHGMSHSKDGFSVVDMATTMNNGGTPNGRTLTGLMTDMDLGKGRGYVIDDGVFTPFDAPGSDWTTAWDMNPARTIVGWFEDTGTSNVHGYLLEKWSVSDDALTGTYTTIDFPLTPTTPAAYTDVFGINAAGDIVGKFRETATGPFHGYIATRKAQ